MTTRDIITRLEQKGIPAGRIINILIRLGKLTTQDRDFRGDPVARNRQLERDLARLRTRLSQQAAQICHLKEELRQSSSPVHNVVTRNALQSAQISIDEAQGAAREILQDMVDTVCLLGHTEIMRNRLQRYEGRWTWLKSSKDHLNGHGAPTVGDANGGTAPQRDHQRQAQHA
jgi:hypothetical protein